MALGSTQPLVKMSTRNIAGSKGGRCVRLTTSPPSRAECHEIWEPKPPGTLWATPGLWRDSFTFTYVSMFTRNHFHVQLSAIWNVQPSWGKRVGWSKFSFSQKFTASIKRLYCTYFMLCSLHVHTNARNFLHCCCMGQFWRMTKTVLQKPCLLFCHMISFVLTFEGKLEQRMVSWKRQPFLTSPIGEASICNIIWRRREGVMKEEVAEEEMTKHEKAVHALMISLTFAALVLR